MSIDNIKCWFEFDKEKQCFVLYYTFMKENKQYMTAHWLPPGFNDTYTLDLFTGYVTQCIRAALEKI